MNVVSGILEAHGPATPERGGMKYSYITVRQASGRMLNIPDILAFTNVQAAITRLLSRGGGDEDRRIIIYTKDDNFIYALEEAGGVLNSDADHIRQIWMGLTAFAYGPIAISSVMITLGFAFEGIGQIGMILFVFSLFSLLMFFVHSIRFWPEAQAARFLEGAR